MQRAFSTLALLGFVSLGLGAEGCPPSEESSPEESEPMGECAVNLGRYYEECGKSLLGADGAPRSRDDAVSSCQTFASGSLRCAAQAMGCPDVSCSTVDKRIQDECGARFETECGASVDRLFDECDAFFITDVGTSARQEDLRGECTKDAGYATCVHDCAYDPAGKPRSCTDSTGCFRAQCFDSSTLGASGTVDVHHPCPSPAKPGEAGGTACRDACEVAAGWGGQGETACSHAPLPYATCLQSCARTWNDAPQCVTCLAAVFSLQREAACNTQVAKMSECRVQTGCGGHVLGWFPEPR